MHILEVIATGIVIAGVVIACVAALIWWAMSGKDSLR